MSKLINDDDQELLYQHVMNKLITRLKQNVRFLKSSQVNVQCKDKYLTMSDGLSERLWLFMNTNDTNLVNYFERDPTHFLLTLSRVFPTIMFMLVEEGVNIEPISHDSNYSISP